MGHGHGHGHGQDHDHTHDPREMLRRHGLRVTEQRMAILGLLEPAADQDLHLTPLEIHERLTASGTTIDVATVYRSVTTLANLGVLHTMATAPGVIAYGLATHGHHHAVCVECGAVLELPQERIQAALDVFAALSGFKVGDSAVVVHGRCKDCQAKDA